MNEQPVSAAFDLLDCQAKLHGESISHNIKARLCRDYPEDNLYLALENADDAKNGLWLLTLLSSIDEW